VQHDAHVASRRLQTLAASPPKGLPPETLFMMGRLAEHYAVSAGKAGKRFAKTYRKVRGRWKALRQKAQSLAPPAAPELITLPDARQAAVPALDPSHPEQAGLPG